MKAVNISDLTNPESGKSYREENNEKTHNIPLGTLVEIDFDDSYLETPVKGLRLFVVSHDRDCDGTPLYSLSFNKDWEEKPGNEYIPRIAYKMQLESGYNEGSLKVIKQEDAEDTTKANDSDNSNDKTLEYDKLAKTLCDKFGESLIEEDDDDQDPYNWWLGDVTVKDIIGFIKNNR